MKSKSTNAYTAATVLLLLAAGRSANAQLLGSDGFGYTTGSIAGDGVAGTFWGGAWGVKTPGTSAVVSPGLGYTDGSGNTLNTSGNAFSTTGTTSTTNPQRYFANTLGTLSGATATAGSGTIWMSFLWQGLNTSATGSLFRQASFGLYSGMTASGGSGSELIDIGMPNISSATVSTVNPNLSIWYGGHGIVSGSSSTAPAVNSTVAANTGAPILVVLEMQMDNVTTTADNLTMWLDPTLGGTGPTGTAYTFNVQDLSSINGIRLSSGNGNATYGALPGEQAVDEINVGDTYADVTPFTAAPVPEPATATLAAIGSVGLLGLIRRRK